MKKVVYVLLILVITINCSADEHSFYFKNLTPVNINVYVKYNNCEVEHILIPSNGFVKSQKYTEIIYEDNLVVIIIAYRKNNGELSHTQENFSFEFNKAVLDSTVSYKAISENIYNSAFTISINNSDLQIRAT